MSINTHSVSIANPWLQSDAFPVLLLYQVLAYFLFYFQQCYLLVLSASSAVIFLSWTIFLFFRALLWTFPSWSQPILTYTLHHLSSLNGYCSLSQILRICVHFICSSYSVKNSLISPFFPEGTGNNWPCSCNFRQAYVCDFKGEQFLVDISYSTLLNQLLPNLFSLKFPVLLNHKSFQIHLLNPIFLFPTSWTFLAFDFYFLRCFFEFFAPVNEDLSYIFCLLIIITVYDWYILEFKYPLLSKFASIYCFQAIGYFLNFQSTLYLFKFHTFLLVFQMYEYTSLKFKFFSPFQCFTQVNLWFFPYTGCWGCGDHILSYRLLFYPLMQLFNSSKPSPSKSRHQ